MTAFGGGYGGEKGAAGTVYLETTNEAAGGGRLYLDNTNWGFGILACTVPSEPLNLGGFASVCVTNTAMLVVTTNTTVNLGTAVIEGGGRIKIRSTNGVTFPSPYVLGPAYSLSLDTPVAAAGSWTIASNGVLTHSQSHYQAAEPDYRLDLTLNGNLTVATGGVIDAYANGYAAGTGPGATIAAHLQAAASHAGVGGHRPDLGFSPAPAYGSAFWPTNPGSGAQGARGGGVILLNVSGTTTVHGAIDAIGYGRAAGGRNGGASGGSILLRSGWLTGNGTVSARGGEGWKDDSMSGGGGRIAIILSQGSDLGGVQADARGGSTGTTLYSDGGSGTLYVQFAGVEDGAGRVILNNGANSTPTNTTTWIPAGTLGGVPLGRAECISVTNGARWTLGSNMEVRDVLLAGGTSLDLNGYTLVIRHRQHAFNGTVYENGGRIIWLNDGTVFVIH
jgi:hypothetical protein